MDNFLSFLIGILSSSVVAVSTIYFVFWKWKPRIEISKYIVKSKTLDNKDEYKIKFINNSNYPANDVKVELWRKIEYNATSSSNGKNEDVEKIKISTPEWLTISGYCSDNKIKETKYAPHCITVRILNEKPEEILKAHTNQSYEFKISVKHGLSNISKTFSQQYNDLAILKKGRFIFGNSLETEEI